MSDAPCAKSSSSGRTKVRNAGATATSAKPPSMQKAATRSPARTGAPSGALRTIPATSLPGTKGSSGSIWYCPRVCSTSGKETPAARTSTTTPAPGVRSCDASGSGRSAARSAASGPSKLTICTARIGPTVSRLVARQVAWAGHGQLRRPHAAQVLQGALGDVARADPTGQLGVELSDQGAQVLGIVGDFDLAACQPRHAHLLVVHELRLPVELALQDGQRVDGDERAEARAVVGLLRRDLGLEELAHRVQQLGEARAVLHHATCSRRCRTSYSTSAARRPRTASSTLRSSPEMCRSP